ncbi:MAG: tetratricopeptide repeat protein [Treponema sp.]|nr:tetratricopeptide repeat protein [Treponema sp.]
MSVVQVAIVAFLIAAIAFIVVFLLKSMLQPKKLDAIAKLIKQQKYAAAQKVAKSLIAKNQRDYPAHYYLGKAYLADKKNELALMEFKLVNQNAVFNGTLPETEFRKQLSQLLMKFNQSDEALKEFLLLTKLDPTNADNYYMCGKIYEQKNQAEQALGFFQKAIGLNKRHVKAHASLGLALFKAKQLAEARKEIDLAISLDPETFSSYYYLGKILKESKDYSGAVKAFEKALRDPEFRQKSLLERGSCYMMANALDNAQLEFEKAVQASKDPKSPETLYAHYFLAACYEKNRKIEDAIGHWQAIYDVNHSFKDVGAKLSEYKDLQANDSLKEYLTSSSDEFSEICKKAALSGMGFACQKLEEKKWGVQMIAVESGSDDWKSQRKQNILLCFFREPDPIEDGTIRKILDTSKSMNCVKAFVCTSSGFTGSATGFAESRPIELVGKERLEVILSKAGI